MTNITIICGMDRCGKSTLVNDIRKNIFTNPGTIVHHSSTPPVVFNKNEWEVTNYVALAKMACKTKADFIFDRFHLGTYVYGTRYRNQPKDIVERIERQFDPEFLRKTRLIVLTDYSEKIQARDDGDTIESTADDLDKTKQLFREAFEQSKIETKCFINVTEIGGFSNLFPTVKEFLS